MSERAFAWRRASRGLNLIGLGVFLLLTTQGVLPWSFWADAVRLWPVLLVALGLRLVVEKAAPWAVLLSPLLIQGTLAWLALHPQRVEGPERAFADSEWSSFSLARPEEAQDWTLDAELAFAQLDVGAGAGPENLLEGRSAGTRDRSVWLQQGGDHPRARLRGERDHSGIVWHEPREAWEIRLAPDLPVRVDVGLAFCRGPIDLGALEATRVDLDGAFNDLRIVLPVPRADTRLDFDGAFSNLEFAVPDGVPVRVQVEGLLNGVENGAREGAGGPAYRLDVEGAFNAIRVVRSSES